VLPVLLGPEEDARLLVSPVLPRSCDRRRRRAPRVDEAGRSRRSSHDRGHREGVAIHPRGPRRSRRRRRRATGRGSDRLHPRAQPRDCRARHAEGQQQERARGHGNLPERHGPRVLDADARDAAEPDSRCREYLRGDLRGDRGADKRPRRLEDGTHPPARAAARRPGWLQHRRRVVARGFPGDPERHGSRAPTSTTRATTPRRRTRSGARRRARASPTPDRSSSARVRRPSGHRAWIARG